MLEGFGKGLDAFDVNGVLLQNNLLEGLEGLECGCHFRSTGILETIARTYEHTQLEREARLVGIGMQIDQSPGQHTTALGTKATIAQQQLLQRVADRGSQ